MESFSSYLPSKFFGLVLGAIALVGILIGLAYFWPAPPKNNPFAVSEERAKETLSAIAKVAAEKDSDGDGLKDWEESLWKTDSGKTDSDGDGTKDGEEVKMGRNPAVRGPGDSISENPVEEFSKTSTSSPENLTTTQEISREVLSRYLIAKQSGIEVDVDTIEKIVTNSLTEYEKSKFARLYGEGDLKITKDTSKERVIQYGNETGFAISSHAIWEESELSIINRAANTRRQSELEKLDPIIAGYKNIINALLAVEVPEIAKKSHLGLLNGFSNLLFISEQSKKLFDDPASAIIAFGKLPEEGYKLYLAFGNASSLFSSLGITYKKEDGGFFLTDFSKSIDFINRQ